MRVLFSMSGGRWVPLMLSPGVGVGLVPGEGAPAAVPGAGADGAEARLVVASGEGRDVVVHLLVKPGACVRVGGRRVIGGLKRLAGRRETIVVGGRPFYVAVDEVARVGVFDGDEVVPCGRCRGDIAPGTGNVVRCPICGTVMHEDEAGERRCYSYGPCVSCGTEPNLDEASAWSPEML